MGNERWVMRDEIIPRREAPPEPSGAAGWVAVVLHGTPGVKARLSVRMSRRFARVPVEARAIPH